MREKYLAIIPARGGSKRIPRKNIKPFLDVPIIKYSIDAAKESYCFDEVMVSTDDEEIAQISKSYGAVIPFMRSKRNASDKATLFQVVDEVISHYQQKKQVFDYCCCILPTAPFLTSHKIISGLNLLKKYNAQSVITIVKYTHPIQRALFIKGGKLDPLHPNNIGFRTQDFESAYYDAGQFYWMRTASFLKAKTFFTDDTLPLELSSLEIQDIDTAEDWRVAEMKYHFLKRK